MGRTSRRPTAAVALLVPGGGRGPDVEPVPADLLRLTGGRTAALRG
ncbi:hypothetical protein ACH9EU_09805 [Kocuria sp. M1R5S2]